MFCQNRLIAHVSFVLFLIQPLVAEQPENSNSESIEQMYVQKQHELAEHQYQSAVGAFDV